MVSSSLTDPLGHLGDGGKYLLGGWADMLGKPRLQRGSTEKKALSPRRPAGGHLGPPTQRSVLAKTP